MNSRSAPLFLVLVVALALAVRVAPGRDLHLADDERDLNASRWLVDDPTTAQHLRRMELTLAEGAAPERDPFLAHPRGGEIAALPVFDALIAGIAQRFVAHTSGDPSLAGVDEADLEDFALRVGTFLGILAVVVAGWAAWIIARGRLHAALAAGLVLALAPAAVHAGEIGHVDALVLVLVLYALLARSTVCALRADDALSAVLESMLAGVLAGLLSATSGVGAWIAAPTAIALAVRAWRAEPRQAAIAVRAGLLFALVAAFVARMPLAEGPWEIDSAGVVARWAAGSADVLLALAAPFALRLLVPAQRVELGVARGSRGLFALAGCLAVLVLLAWEAPRAVRALSPGLAAWWHARDLRAVLDAQASPLIGAGDTLKALSDLSFVGLAAVPAALWLVVRRRDPETIYLVLSGVACSVLAILEREYGALAVSAAAWILAAALRELAERDGDRKAARLALFVAIALAPHALVPWLRRMDPSQREERIAFVAGLRWMRANTEASAPFNNSAAHWREGVLADPRAGPLVAYHARRPCVGSAAAWLTDAASARAVESLSSGRDETAFSDFAHERDVRWVIGAPRFLREEPRDASDASVSVRLALDGATPLTGWTRAHAADRHVGLDGHAPQRRELGGPVISIWEYDGLPDTSKEAVIRPR